MAKEPKYYSITRRQYTGYIILIFVVFLLVGFLSSISVKLAMFVLFVVVFFALVIGNIDNFLRG
jgi:succinate-acetate transporter protein